MDKAIKKSFIISTYFIHNLKSIKTIFYKTKFTLTILKLYYTINLKPT
jgi:hypothetical protein